MSATKYEQSRSNMRPKVISKAFIASMERLLKELDKNSIKEIAEKRNMTVADLQSLLADSDATSQLAKLDIVKDDDYAERTRLLERQYLSREVANEINFASAVSVSISYKGGYTAQVSNLEQATVAMDQENGWPESFSIRRGTGSAGTHVSLVMTGYRTKYDVSGDRQTVDHYSREIVNILRAAEPPHAFLYEEVLKFFVSVAVTVLGIYLVGTLVDRFAPGARFVGLSQTIPVSILLLLILLSLFLGVGKLLDYAFPKLQFDYGNSKKHIKEKQVILFGVVTAVLVPLLLDHLF